MKRTSLILVILATLVLLTGSAYAFTVGGSSSYNKTAHKLSMGAGSSVQVNCNGAALHYQQLGSTIGGLTCDPFPTTTTTAPPTTTTPPTTTPPTTTPPPPPGNCPLTSEAKACWAAHTGVPGWSEAQIVAGQSPLVHSTGNVVVTTPGAVIENRWIDGCILVKADNVTIRNTLVRTSDGCEGNRAAISAGNQDSNLQHGLQVVDTEVDAGNTLDGYDYMGIGANFYTLTRVNVHGATHTIWMGGQTYVYDSFIHDPSTATVTNHNEAIDGDSAHDAILSHSWVSSWNGNTTQAVTGAIFVGGSWGPPGDWTITNNFFEGGNGTDLVLDNRMLNTIVTGNRLSPHTAWTNQYTYQFQVNAGDVWSDNLDSVSGAVINP